MDEDFPPTLQNSLIAVQAPEQPSKTFRLKLATSLRLQAERVARCQGVSVGYLITKAIEEKISRVRHQTELHAGTKVGVHLVARNK